MKYGKVWRSDLWATLKGYGVRGKLLGFIKSLYKECKACVRVRRVRGICVRTGSKTGVPLISMAV